MPSHHWWYSAFLPWVEPLATVGALVAASVAAIYAARVYRREVVRDERIERREWQAQASLVAAWLAVGPVRSRSGTSTKFALWVRNASELPVTDVRVEHYLNAPVSGPDVVDMYTVGPARDPVYLVMAVPDAEPNLGVLLEFVDSSGQRWARYPDGTLTALQPNARAIEPTYEGD